MTTLDELEEIKELVNNDKHFKYKNIVNFNCESIKQALKALEIIIKKKVNILLLELAENVNEYNERIVPNGRLTEEEFDLLKEMLE